MPKDKRSHSEEPSSFSIAQKRIKQDNTRCSPSPKLPYEILHLVISKLTTDTDQGTLATCTLVNKAFQKVATPILWSHLRITNWKARAIHYVFCPCDKTEVWKARMEELLSIVKVLTIGHHDSEWCSGRFTMAPLLPNLKTIQLRLNHDQFLHGETYYETKDIPHQFCKHGAFTRYQGLDRWKEHPYHGHVAPPQDNFFDTSGICLLEIEKYSDGPCAIMDHLEHVSRIAYYDVCANHLQLDCGDWPSMKNTSELVFISQAARTIERTGYSLIEDLIEIPALERVVWICLKPAGTPSSHASKLEPMIDGETLAVLLDYYPAIKILVVNASTMLPFYRTNGFTHVIDDKRVKKNQEIVENMIRDKMRLVPFETDDASFRKDRQVKADRNRQERLKFISMEKFLEEEEWRDIFMESEVRQ